MKAEFYKILMIILVVGFVTFVQTPPIHGCAPVFPSTIFSYSYSPDVPTKYGQGQLGVIKPTYGRYSLIIAYRYLMGAGGVDSEKKKEESDCNKGTQSRDWESWGKPIKDWLKERKKIQSIPQIIYISTLRDIVEDGKGYQVYLNCPDDAFITATRTLTERIAKFGADSTEVREWLNAQDMVFSNCSEGHTIPSSALPGLHPLIKADRAYQIAAAYFYSQDFDAAEKLFKEIANDHHSPWREIAPYLAVRALVRKASLSSGYKENDRDMLAKAETELKNILNDSTLKNIHPASAKLLDLVQLRRDPEKRLGELAEMILREKSESKLEGMIADYRFILDQLNVEKPDDLTDWIKTFKGGNLEHSIMKWKEKHTLPWLIGSLSKIKIDNTEFSSLLEEASKITPDSPAYATVTYHLIRLNIDSGKKEEARKKLDSFLSENRGKLPPSSLNLFIALKGKLARNLDEFLSDAKRVPVGIFYDESGDETSSGYEVEKVLKPFIGLEYFDDDSTAILNRNIPLSVMLKAARSSILPEHLRQRIALSAWCRAVLLEKDAVAEEFASLAQSLMPGSKIDFTEYLSEKNMKDRRFKAILIILKNPGIQIYLREGIGRLDSIGKIDDYRDNWWCSLMQHDKDECSRAYQPSRGLPKLVNESPGFLTEIEKREAESEWNALLKMETAPNYLCKQVLERVKTNPNDRNLPEALHFAVRTTRYGCTDKETSGLSEYVYSILHKRFPGNPWAKKTPYWF